MKSLSSILPFLLLLLLPSLTEAWGTLGHEMVANIAWHRVSSDTKTTIESILGPNNATEATGSPLAAVADWADRVRHFLPWSAGLHYIDIRDQDIPGGCHPSHLNPQCHFDPSRDCVEDACVAGAILNYTHQLLVPPPTATNTNNNKNPSMLRGKKSSSEVVGSDPKHQRQALMFLTHFVGDIHQPLHCSRTTDKGGNDIHVRFPFNISDLSSSGRNYLHTSTTMHSNQNEPLSKKHHHTWNLHSVWDTGLIDVALVRLYNESRSTMEHSLIERIDQHPFETQTYLACSFGGNRTCAMSWGSEAWSMAMKYAYQMNATSEVLYGATIDEAYYQTRLPILEERLMAAGIRLAATLDAIFATTSGTTFSSSNDDNKIEESDVAISLVDVLAPTKS